MFPYLKGATTTPAPLDTVVTSTTVALGAARVWAPQGINTFYYSLYFCLTPAQGTMTPQKNLRGYLFSMPNNMQKNVAKDNEAQQNISQNMKQ